MCRRGWGWGGWGVRWLGGVEMGWDVLDLGLVGFG